jgi:hypothetical protein
MMSLSWSINLHSSDSGTLSSRSRRVMLLHTVVSELWQIQHANSCE